MKPLSDFDVECVVEVLGSEYASIGGLGWEGVPEARIGRLRSRLKRFVLSHPLVTPDHARLFRKAMAGKDDGE